MRRIAFGFVCLCVAAIAGLHLLDAGAVFALYQRAARADGTPFRGFAQPPDDASRRVGVVVCSAVECSRPGADLSAPLYDMPADRLQAAMHALVMATPGVSEAWRGPDADVRNYIHLSPLLRAPEAIHVVFVPVDASRSTLRIITRPLAPALGSAARPMIERWLAALDKPR